MDLRFFSEGIARNAKILFQPYLYGIYSDIPLRPGLVEQVGSGFLVEYNAHPFLVTARHTLYGRTGTERAVAKSIFLDGGLYAFEGLPDATIYSSLEVDLAIVHLPDVPLNNCLPYAAIADDHNPQVISLYGYLARDFRRDYSKGILKPKPFLFSNLYKCIEFPKIAVRYTVRGNRDSFSNMNVMSPRLEGLSGGPMIDSIALYEGRLRVSGVLTDMVREDGSAYGPNVQVVRALMKKFLEERENAA